MAMNRPHGKPLMYDSPILVQLRTGRVATQGRYRSAYGKQSRSGRVAAGTLGLEGDEVGNPRVHGGPDKAVYAYARSNYPRWIADHPHHAGALVPGGFGENLLIDGLDEATVCIGDHWQIGTAVLAPCQPRQPCATMARWFDDARMVKAMVQNGRSGWYCRVEQPGTMIAGDTLALLHRPNPDWPIARVLEISYTAAGNRDQLHSLAAVPGLAEDWAAWAARQAETARPRSKPL